VRLGSRPLSRASGGNGGPCHTSLASTPRPTSSSWAASMSETISVPSAEPGEAAVIPLPKVTQAFVVLLGSLDVGYGNDMNLKLHLDSRAAGARRLLLHVSACLTHLIPLSDARV